MMCRAPANLCRVVHLPVCLRLAFIFLICRVVTKSIEVAGEPWSADRIYNVAAKEYIGKDGKDGYVFVDTLYLPHDIIIHSIISRTVAFSLGAHATHYGVFRAPLHANQDTVISF